MSAAPVGIGVGVTILDGDRLMIGWQRAGLGSSYRVTSGPGGPVLIGGGWRSRADGLRTTR